MPWTLRARQRGAWQSEMGVAEHKNKHVLIFPKFMLNLNKIFRFNFSELWGKFAKFEFQQKIFLHLNYDS